MAENVNANIRVDLDTSAALASLQTLQNQISNFNRSIVQGNAQATAAQKSMVSTLTAQISATKQFSTSMVNVENSVSRLGRAIDKNKLSLGEYFRYGAASSKAFGSMFKKEHNQIMELATDRVKRLQTQYIALGEAQNGVTRAMAVRPMHLFNADTAIGIQRQQLFNKLLHDGSTSILNWGKNTQWAGRQLMVGFTVPLTIFGGVAGQIFMDLERQVVNFRRVYGDAMTPAGETDQMLAEIQALGKEFTKYGIAVKDTVGLAGQVAAAGAQGDKLIAATAQSTRLATLGMIEMDQAMTATMALQTAFKLSNEELAQSIDFLNAVENQTVLSLNDVSQAIPLVAPIIKGLGGDVQDLAIFLTAMREGGVNAAEGANALKSGLASLINPTKNAKEQLKKVGINISDILSQNKGDIRAIVTEFGAALGELGKFERQQTLAKVFGKYQFARLGALFENISTEGSQAQRVVDLTGQSFEELGALAEKELSAIEESIGMKFTGAIERLKLAIAPIGEVFLRIATPIIDVVTKLLDKFNELSPGVKQFITVLVAGVGVIIPTVIMLIGLFGNFIGQAIKGFALFNNFFNRLRGGGKDIEYLANEEIDAMAAAASLEGKTESLTSAFNTQRAALINLTRAYRNYATAANAMSINLPQAVRPLPAKGFAEGGVVGGRGNKDTEPALLTPGEFVMNREATEKFGPVLDAMNRGNVSGYAKGSRMFTFGDRTFEAQSSRSSSAIEKLLKKLGDISEDQKTQLIYALEKLQATNDITKTSLQSALKEVGIEIRNLPSGMADAHVFEQSQKSITGAEARRLAAASGSPITAQESLKKLDILDELEAAVPGSTRILARSDFVVDLPKAINSALKNGLSAGAFADAFEASGIQKWGKIIKMSGASAEDATPEFMLLERKIIELARNAELAGLKVGDVADKSRGIISFGDITNQAVAELKSAGHSMGIVEKAISDLNGRFRTFQVGINSEFIPALQNAGRNLGFIIEETEVTSKSGRKEKGYSVKREGDTTPIFFRGQSQREKSPGSYGNATAIDLSEYYDQGGSAGEATGRGAIDGLERSTQSQSDSRESQRVANDVANGFENQLKARVGDVRKAGEMLGGAGVSGVANGSSDIRKVLKEQLGVGPLVEEEQANLRETIKLRQAENREIQRRAQLLARQKGYGPDVARRIAAEQIAQERAAAMPPVVLPATSGAETAPGVAEEIKEKTEELSDSLSDLDSETKKSKGKMSKLGGALMKGSAKLTGAMFAMDGLVFGLSMMDNKVGEFAQKLMPAVFGFQTIAMMLPMLANPMGIAIAAIAAVGGSLLLLDQHMKSVISEGRKLADAMSLSAKTLNETGAFYGRKTLAQRQEVRERKEATGVTSQEAEKAVQYLESEIGKVLQEETTLAITKLGSSAAVEGLGTKLGSMIMQGAITRREANAIAALLGEQIQNKQFGIDVIGNVEKLIDPQGRDLKKHPYDIAVRLVEQQSNVEESMTQSLSRAIGNAIQIDGLGEELSVGAVGAQGVALGMFSDIPYLSDIARNMFGFLNQDMEIAIQSATTYGKTIGNNVRNSYDILNATIERNRKLIKEANKEDKPEIRKKALEEEAKIRQKILESTQKQAEEFAKAPEGFQVEILRGAQEAAKEMYAADPAMTSILENIFARTGALEKTIRFNIETAIAGGTLNPSTVQYFMDQFVNDTDATATLNFLISSQGIDTTNKMLLEILNIKDEDLRKQAIINLIVNTPEGLDQETLNALDETGELTSQAQSMYAGPSAPIDISGAKKRIDDAQAAIEDYVKDKDFAQMPDVVQKKNTLEAAKRTLDQTIGIRRQEERKQAESEGMPGLSFDEIEKRVQASDEYRRALAEVTTAQEEYNTALKNAEDTDPKLIQLTEEKTKAEEEYTKALVIGSEKVPAIFRDRQAEIQKAIVPLQTSFTSLQDTLQNITGKKIDISYEGMNEKELTRVNGIMSEIAALPPDMVKQIDVDAAIALENAKAFEVKWKKIKGFNNLEKELGLADKFSDEFEKFGIKYEQFAKLPNIYKEAMLVQIDALVKTQINLETTLSSKGSSDRAKMEASDAIGKIRKELATLFGGISDNIEEGGDGGDTGPGGDGPSGGAQEKKVSALRELINGYLDQIKLYGNLNASYKQLIGKRKEFLKLFEINKGISDQLRKAGYSESFIDEVLAMGPAAAKKFAEKNIQYGKKGKILGKTQMGRRTEALSIQQETLGAADELVSQVDVEKNRGLAAQILAQRGLAQNVIDELIKDDKVANLIANQASLGKKGKAALDKYIAALINVSVASDGAASETGKLEEKIKIAKLAFEKAVKPVEDAIKKEEEYIDSIEKEIDALEELNDADNRRIRDLDRKIEMYNRDIDAIERLNEKDQERIETLRRQDEERNRIAESLNKDLEKLSEKESEIQDAYKKRIDALEKVFKINDRIAQQQKDQLNIAQAISQGDIYAATAAIQEANQSQAMFAQEQQREALNAGMEAEIAGLRTEGGLTREQAEKQISDIKEQSYQTSLLIRDIEDDIYDRNINIDNIKKSIRSVEDDKLKIEDAIYNRETEILNIQTNLLDPAKKRYDALVAQRDEMKNILDTQIAEYQAEIDLHEIGAERIKQINDLAAAWQNVKKQIADANKILKQGYEKEGAMPKPIVGESQTDFAARLAKWEAKRKALLDQYNASIASAYAIGTAALGGSASTTGAFAGGLMKKYYGGGNVIGSGARDSISAMLSPGEFVVRKAMVDKYGIPMFDSINQGSFSMPRYNTQTSGIGEVDMGAQNNTSVIAPMYNSYSVNVNVSNTSASADEIANRTIMKIRQMQDTQIRSGRGY